MTAQLTTAMAALRKEFQPEITNGLIVHLGTTNCRRKNNTETGPWSEHAWPNAVDVMLKRIPGTASPTPEAKALGYRIAKWMRTNPQLWSEVFWQVAAHFDHVHGTATPRANFDNKQVPPCAGGPPDDGDDEMSSSAQKMMVDLAFNAFPDFFKGDANFWYSLSEDDAQWNTAFRPALSKAGAQLWKERSTGTGTTGLKRGDTVKLT